MASVGTLLLAVTGNYSAGPAYRIHFIGRIAQPHLQDLWLLLQNRNWTANRPAARNWPRDDLCPFCDQIQETAAHTFFSSVQNLTRHLLLMLPGICGMRGTQGVFQNLQVQTTVLVQMIRDDVALFKSVTDCYVPV